MSRKTLILGGIKSGKSRYAENLTDHWNGPRSLIATATPNDEEMSTRIEKHKSERSSSFNVVEEPVQLGKAISKQAPSSCVIVDCLTLWMTNLLLLSDEKTSLELEKSNFLDSFKNSESRIILVSNESNMGVIPMGELSRRYCDEIGLLHQELSSICDDVYLMVAGLPLQVKTDRPF